MLTALTLLIGLLAIAFAILRVARGLEPIRAGRRRGQVMVAAIYARKSTMESGT